MWYKWDPIFELGQCDREVDPGETNIRKTPRPNIGWCFDQQPPTTHTHLGASMQYDAAFAAPGSIVIIRVLAVQLVAL